MYRTLARRAVSAQQLLPLYHRTSSHRISASASSSILASSSAASLLSFFSFSSHFHTHAPHCARGRASPTTTSSSSSSSRAIARTDIAEQSRTVAAAASQPSSSSDAVHDEHMKYKRVKPSKSKQQSLPDIVQATLSSVVPSGTAISPSDINDPTLVSRIQSQLSKMDESGSRASSQTLVMNQVATVGLDTIDLSRSVITEDEVFADEIAPSAAMRKLMDLSRRGDSAARMQIQRIEKVSEKTREIVGRVLFEESVKIGNTTVQQPHHVQQLLATHDTTSLIDLRTTSSFHINRVRYSTDLAWATVQWILPKDSTLLQLEEKKTPQNAQQLTYETEKYQALRSRVTATLNHIVSRLRYTLGRELDLKYTPTIKFAYDVAHDAKLEREKEIKRAQERQERNLKQLMEDLREMKEEREEEAKAEPQINDQLSSSERARQKRLLLKPRPSTEHFDADAFNTPEQLTADQEFDNEFDAQRTYFLPKRKIAALIAREKLKEDARLKKRQAKAELARVREATKGVSLKSQPAPAPGSTDPVVLRNYLNTELARVVREKSLTYEDHQKKLKEMRSTKAQLTQLQQIEAIARKSRINPVEDLRDNKIHEQMPHYPKNWRSLKDQFWKKSDRTRGSRS